MAIRNDEQNALANSFLSGGGEMGKLIRATDWSQTPLGPIERWPQSLRTAVSLCISSNFPISIAWGPEHVQIYNDGYWPICGGKHPHSMGQNFRECWASAWPAIGEAFNRALAGESQYLVNRRVFVDRNGYLEETFFTFSFSPIRDESGGIGGLFHPVTETTAKMLSERRTHALRDLAARAGKAQTLERTFAAAAETLSDYEFDLPFALFYLIEGEGRRARLLNSNGLAPGTPAAPRSVDLQGSSPIPWRLDEVAHTGQSVQLDELDARFGALACGPYPESPRTALVLPVRLPGSERASAIIVAGVSSRLPLDEEYRSFYGLLTANVSAAVANARAYEEERKRAEALAEIDRAKTLFFSNISHEFRTPLTLMLGPLEEALTGDPAQLPSHRSELELAHRNGLRLLKLVNSLLDFSRIEAGRMQASFQPTDLAGLTADLASNFRAACERGGVVLDVDCPTLPEPVHVDRDMWEKIVLNLLSNAFKFTFEGRITVRLTAVDGAAELTVGDTGVGIPAHELPRLFERFHRIENQKSRTYEGSGIGLALVQELVKLHGGTIHAESALDSGTVITLKLPLGTAHLPARRLGAPRSSGSTALRAAAYVEEALHWLPDSERSRDEAADTEESAELSSRGARILFADDNADMRAYVRRVLGGSYVVETVSNGQAALEWLGERRPDLVLADIMMPHVDGFALLRTIRDDPGLRDLAVIVISARAGDEARAEGLDAGADDYLTKPFAARELLARVENSLKLARVRREATTELCASERRFRTIVDQATTGVVQTDAAGRISLVNKRWCEMLGYTETELLQMNIAEVLEPGGSAPMWDAIGCLAQGGSDFEMEVRYRRKDGSLLWTNSSVNALRNDAGEYLGLVAVGLDITERKRTEALQAAQKRVLELTVENAPLTEALETLVRTIEAQSQTAILASISLLDSDGRSLRLGVAPNVPEAIKQVIDGLAIGPSAASCGTAAHARRPVYVADIATDPLWDQYRDLALSHDLRACWSTPIISARGELFGTFAIYSREARQPTSAERELAAIATDSASLVIERKRAEQRLRDSEERYRRLVDLLPVAVYACDAQSGKITFFNDYAANIWGRAPEIGDAHEFFCRSFKLWSSDGTPLPPTDTPMTLALQEGRGVRNREIVLERSDGTRVNVLVNVDPIHDDNGQLESAVTGFIDITQIKQAEQLLVEQQKLLEMIAVGVSLNDCLLALCEAVPRLNPDAQASILLASECGTFFSNSINPRPDLRPSFAEMIKALAIGESGISSQPVVCSDIANDAPWPPQWRETCITSDLLACYCSPIPGIEGRFLGSFVLCFDRPHVPSEWEQRLAEFGTHVASIALERDQSSQTLRESESHLRALSQTLERRVEIRTAELRQQTGRLRRLAKELTSAEQRERRRLAAILHDGLQQLLVAAKIRVGQARSQAVDSATAATLEGVSDMVDQAVDSSRDLTRQLRPPVLYEGGLMPALRWLVEELYRLHGLHVTLDGEEAIFPLDDDTKALLFETVRELLFNVVKHAGVNEALVRVRQNGQRLHVAVQDKGAGFDVDAVAWEQDPKQPGVGLFSVRERLAALGGEVTLKSVAGEGTRIELRVPLAEVAEDAPRALHTETLSPAAARPLGGGAADANRQVRILVVDDHPIVREGITNVLANDARLAVIGEAVDGVDAIAAVEHHQPDVVLIDVNMPRMNGVEATREIRGRWPDVRIVALSVDDNEAMVRAMINAGAAVFVSKSDDAEQMIDAVLTATQGQ